MYEELYAAVQKTNALACLECGKCTSVCPVSRFSGDYSPRLMLNQAVKQDFEELFADYDLWSCLTCQRCDQVCPRPCATRLVRLSSKASVPIPAFWKRYRK